MALDNDTRVIGYFAYAPPVYVVCDGDACVITGSKAAMQRYIASVEPAISRYSRIKKTRFGEIMQGIRWGAAYAFDEPSYARFYPLAKKAGLDFVPEDLSSPSLTGMRFVRVQLPLLASQSMMRRAKVKLEALIHSIEPYTKGKFPLLTGIQGQELKKHEPGIRG